MVKTPVLYKSLVVGVIVLFIGIGIQPTLANQIPIITETDGENNDNLPDLIVEDFYLTSRVPEWGYYELWATLKNIGNATALGKFHFKVIIYRLIFRIFPFPVSQWEKTFSENYKIIMPGESQKFIIGSGDEIPRLRGYYRIYVAVNMDKNVEESNYDNNERYENRNKDRIYWW